MIDPKASKEAIDKMIESVFYTPADKETIDATVEHIRRSGPSILSLPSFLEREHGPTRSTLIAYLYTTIPFNMNTGERYQLAVAKFHEITGIPQYDWNGLKESAARWPYHKTMMAVAPQREPMRVLSGVSQGIHPVRGERQARLRFADIDSYAEFEDNPQPIQAVGFLRTDARDGTASIKPSSPKKDKPS